MLPRNNKLALLAAMMTGIGFAQPAAVIAAADTNDLYITGYSAAVVKQQLGRNVPGLTVKNGVVFVPQGHLSAADEAKAVKLLSAVPGVNSVKVVSSAVRR